MISMLEEYLRTYSKKSTRTSQKSCLVAFFVLILASSGMRIGEALELKLNELYIHEDPVRIMIRGETSKNGDNRWTF